MPAVIHLAHGISRKNGTTYRARAFVSHDGVKHSHRVALGDTREEAEAGVIAYLRETYQRDNLPFPTETINHGRLAGPFLDNWHFGS